MFPLFVPSKGRAKNSFLIDQLKASSYEWFYVVEPQEYDSYTLIIPPKRLIVLPSNNQGIAFVRNEIFNNCKTKKIDWYWMLDDDITGFFEVISKKNLKISLDSALKRAETNIRKLTERMGIGQIGLEYQQYSWSATKRYKFNSYCDVCVAINSNVKAKYRNEVNLKEDRDFTLQILSSGYSTARISDVAFSCPKNGSNEGGLKPVYQDTVQEHISNLRMVEFWGSNICSIIQKPDGREDVKINWRFFKNGLK
jgi:hypothetical protein